MPGSAFYQNGFLHSVNSRARLHVGCGVSFRDIESLGLISQIIGAPLVPLRKNCEHLRAGLRCAARFPPKVDLVWIVIVTDPRQRDARAGSA